MDDGMGRSETLAPGSDATPATYFSRHGGLWTDRSDADAEIGRRLRAGLITPAEAEMLRRWIATGYVIIPRAVDPKVCDAVRRDMVAAWTEGDERLRICTPSREYVPLTKGSPTERIRLVDIYVYFESALRALFSEKISRFLRIVFEDDPLLFQSLSFERGSEQAMHQDTAYVVVNSPMELAASWIALEDIREGSGELMYYEGSHRLPEYDFGGQYKHWNPVRDGIQQHEEWNRLLNQNAKAMGLPTRTFLPKKGDALIWSADLAHGGSAVTDRSLTRRSLVGHYCPNRAEPHYFSFQPDRRARASYRDNRFCSSHYAVSDAPTPTPAPKPMGLFRRLIGGRASAHS
jgi:ectoine hydroxylase-related dioxygenase (phytanoyl-CoA dioxygenase family)